MKSQNNTKKTAYYFLVSNEGRDFYLLLPFIYYLETYKNYTVTFEFTWDAHKIRKHRPDLVMLPNVRGQQLYWEIADYCKQNDILVFHHDSEGNFNSENEQYDYWGFNHTKAIYSPIVFTWNYKIKNYLKAKFPDKMTDDLVKISGAPGFDKYKYLPFKSREEILSKYGLEKYQKVVGYAGWAFGKIYNKELDDILTNLSLEKVSGTNWLIEQRDLVEGILRDAIKTNPDTLFILKKHPRENFESDYRDSRNEMNQLTEYPNVLYLKDQEEIQDLIAISDLWMAFESTSIMEAWLLDKPTLMINPVTDFVRAEIYKGALIVKTKAEMAQAFSELFERNNIAYFNTDNITQNRDEIIRSSIGFADGLNHLRCAYYFNPFLDENRKTPTKPSLNMRFLRLYWLLHIGKYFYIRKLYEKLPKFKKTIWVFENYKLDKINQLKSEIYVELHKFYQNKRLEERISSNDFWKELDL